MSALQPGLEPRFGPDGLVPVVVQDQADGRVLMVAYADTEALAMTASSGEMHFHSRERGRLWRKGESSGNVLHLVRLDLDCDGDALLATVRPHGPTCHRNTRSCFDPEPAPAGHERAPAKHERAPAKHEGAPAGHEGAPAGHEGAPAKHEGAPAKHEGAPVGHEPAPAQDFAWLETLWRTIERRRAERPAGSYTTSLLDGGVDATARKVTEEATEVLMAAKDDAAAASSGQDRSTTTEALAGEAADLVFHTLVLLAERNLEPRAVIDTLKRRHAD